MWLDLELGILPRSSWVLKRFFLTDQIFLFFKFIIFYAKMIFPEEKKKFVKAW
jgi:hypothetical protein